METGTWIALAAVLISVVGLLLSSRKDTRQDAAEMAEIKTSLNNIQNGVDDIRVEMRSHRERLNALEVKLAAVEASDKSAHHRLYTLEAKQ
jgi:hypothetical protein